MSDSDPVNCEDKLYIVQLADPCMDLQNCPRLAGLHILSRKWSYLVLRSLHTPQIFSDVKREFTVVTNRTLSQELKQLVAEGVVIHENSVYSLTEGGKALVAAVEPLHQWAVKYRGLPVCSPSLSCSHCAQYQDLVQIKRTS